MEKRLWYPEEYCSRRWLFLLGTFQRYFGSVCEFDVSQRRQYSRSSRGVRLLCCAFNSQRCSLHNITQWAKGGTCWVRRFEFFPPWPVCMLPALSTDSSVCNQHKKLQTPTCRVITQSKIKQLGCKVSPHTAEKWLFSDNTEKHVWSGYKGAAGWQD